jgi:hypothetical protein
MSLNPSARTENVGTSSGMATCLRLNPGPLCVYAHGLLRSGPRIGIRAAWRLTHLQPHS